MQTAEWLLEDPEASFCYLSDAANSQQREILGQILSRRNKQTGLLESRVLSMTPISDKTAGGQVKAYKAACAAIAEAADEAGLFNDLALAEMEEHETDGPSFFERRRRLQQQVTAPNVESTMNDRAANGRCGARGVRKAQPGDDMPTCAEHATVNIGEKGREAIDAVLRRKMKISDEQAEKDKDKVKAMRTCVGWFSSPACALTYEVSKYVAPFSCKGYAIGENFAQWIAHEESKAPVLAGQLRAFIEDLQAICGGRSYIFFLNAAVVDRLAQLLSLHGYLLEEKDLASAAGGKLRSAILSGYSSPDIMAAVRALAIISDAWMWPTLSAVKPGDDKHILDVCPVVWTQSLRWLREAASNPAAVIAGTMRLDTCFEANSQRTTPRSQPTLKTRGGRAAMDMARIRASLAADPASHALVCEMLTAAFTDMIPAVENHASEFVAGGRFALDKITPALRRKLDGCPTTSTSVETLFAAQKRRAQREGVSRIDTRVGAVVAKRDRTADWAREHALRDKFMAVARKRARKSMGVTMKAQRAAAGKAKEPERVAKLAKKRAGREKKAAELERLKALSRALKYSELKAMQNSDLADQLKLLKLVLGREIKQTALGNRKAYVLRLQALLFAEFGSAANDLPDGDDGYGGEGVRRRKAGKKKGKGKLIKHMGYEWYADEEFEIDCLLDQMVADGGEVPGRTGVPAGTELYLVLWKGFPPDTATWEVSRLAHLVAPAWPSRASAPSL